MNSKPTRYLWEEVEPPHVLAARLEQAIQQEQVSPELQELAKETSSRIKEQQNQIGALIMHLMNTIPPEQVIQVLLDSVFSRHELASCLGVSKEHLIALEAARKEPL